MDNTIKSLGQSEESNQKKKCFIKVEQFIKDSNLSENNKKSLKFLASSLKEDILNDFIEKSFLFEGNPGIGKTYFVENFIKKLDLPILFLGPFKFEYEKATQCKNLKEICEKSKKLDECIIFLDDIQNSLEMEYDFGDCKLKDDERKRFLSLLDHLKRHSKRKFLFMTLNDSNFMEESWLDRIEAKINLIEPNEKSKIKFLNAKYPKYIKKNLSKEIASRTIGYNFRDLTELIKLAFREGNGKITSKSIKKAISIYTPSSLADYQIIHDTKLKFKDVLGNSHLKNNLSYLKSYLKHSGFFKKSGLEKSNVLIFAGPPGTGKTFMVKALAGELQIPLININHSQIYPGRNEAISSISAVMNLSRRFKNCLIFIDELDKLIGKEILSEDNATLGNLEAELDGVNANSKAIVIFTMNNKTRFGSAFHDRVPCFDFNYPTEKERKEFFGIKMQKLNLALIENQLENLINSTEKRTYRQMNRIWNNIVFNLMEKPSAIIKNNNLSANKQEIDEAINEVIGYVQRVNIPTMIG